MGVESVTLKLIVDIDRLRTHAKAAIEDSAPVESYSWSALAEQLAADIVRRITEDPHHVESLAPPHDHPECTSCHGFGEPPTQRWDASAYGLGLPGAKPRVIDTALHEALTSDAESYARDKADWDDEQIRGM